MGRLGGDHSKTRGAHNPTITTKVSSLQALVSGPLYQVPVTSNMHLINEAVSVCLAMNQSGNPCFRPIRK